MFLKKVFLFLLAIPAIAAADATTTVKLSPRVRESALSAEAIADNKMLVYIKPFLKHVHVIDEKEKRALPYVVGFPQEQLSAVKGQIFYAKGRILPSMPVFSIVKPGAPYIDPDTKEILGYSVIYCGSANLVKSGKPSSFMVTEMVEPILVGERLLPASQTTIDFAFTPRPADITLKGKVVGVLHLNDSIAQAGKYDTVVINIGAVDGIQPGNTFVVSEAGRIINDPLQNQRPPITLPNEKIGEIMIFKVFNRVSFGLVTAAKRDIRIKDQVGNN